MTLGRNSAIRGLALLTILFVAWGCALSGDEQSSEQAVPAQDILIEPAGSPPQALSTATMSPAQDTLIEPGDPSSEAPATLMATEAAPPTVDGGAPSSEQPAPANDILIVPEEMILYPAESIAYEKYLDVIRGRPGMADSAVIEGTITSLLYGEICPYQEETCRIEPYPNDWGVVRVDRILEYRPYGAQGEEPIMEQPGQAPTSGSETTPGHAGAGEQPKLGKYEPLQPGQEAEAQFLLTARPAKIRRVQATGSEGTGLSQPSGSDSEQTAEQQVGPGIPTFEAIPREGEAYVFHILPRESTESGAMALPGLTSGSRFRATVQYNGTLYVQGYEVIP